MCYKSTLRTIGVNLIPHTERVYDYHVFKFPSTVCAMQAFFLGLAARGFTRTRIPEEASGPLLCGLREVLLVFVTRCMKAPSRFKKSRKKDN